MKTFKEYRFEKNPIEKKFVYEFIKEHSQGVDPDLIVFGHPSDSLSPKDYLSDREKDIVLSVIQWIGTPVGQGFLSSCGFVQEDKKNQSKQPIDMFKDGIKKFTDLAEKMDNLIHEYSLEANFKEARECEIKRNSYNSIVRYLKESAETFIF